MNWLARLKKLESTSAPTLQNLQKAETGAFVGFVGIPSGPFQNSAPEDDTFTGRLALFTDRGLRMEEAQEMVQRLARRDLEQDDRRLCLECLYLSGDMDHRRCSQWQKIGMINGAAIPADLVTILQRCAGFKNGLDTSMSKPKGAGSARPANSPEKAI